MAVFNFKTAVLCLAVGCVSGPAAFLSSAAGQQPSTDKDKLQGKWQLVSIALEGRVFKREDKSDAWRETFRNDLVLEGDRLGQDGGGKGKFKLDETREPKQITIQDEDGALTFHGIYAVEGDTLKVCLNGDGKSTRRPEEFVSKEGTAVILVTLKKAAKE